MQIILLMITAYLLGSIPNGLWIGKLFYHRDIRNSGSRNLGATNAWRVLGARAGIAVMLLDIAKGSLAAWLPEWFHICIWRPRFTTLLFGLLAILGHSFSIFDHFHGGKAVATSAGMLLVYNWVLFSFCCLMMIIVISISSMVSLASMISFTLVTIVIYLIHDWLLLPLAIILTIFVFYRHRTNIVRIKHHNENLVHFGWNYWHQKRQQS